MKLTSILALALVAAPLAGCMDNLDDDPVTETDQALTSWGGWRNVAGTTNVSLATVTLGGRLYLFDKGLDNTVQMKSFTRGGGWTSSRMIGASTDAPVAATTCWDGLYVFEKGTDGRVYFTTSYDGTAWGGWSEVPGGGQTNAAVSATCESMGENGLRVYMKGLDGHVYENTRAMIVTPVQWTGWSGWHEVGDGWVTNVPLGSMQTYYGKLVLLFKGLNNHSYYKVFNPSGYYTTNGSWSSWKEIGGTTDVALAGAGGMAIAKGINDQAGYYNTYNEANDTWSGWASLGAGTTNAAYAIAQYSGGPTSLAFGYYVFAKGINDNGIYLKSNAPLDPPAPPPPPPPPPGTITSTATINLVEQLPLVWSASFGNGIYDGHLVSIANPTFNTFNLVLLKTGHYSSDCSKPDAVVSLAPGASTSDMTALYGVSSPATPLPLIACPSGAYMPTAFPISVTYTHQ